MPSATARLPPRVPNARVARCAASWSRLAANTRGKEKFLRSSRRTSAPGLAQAPAPTEAPKVLQGVGVVIAAVPRIGRLIVSHDEIKGFMGAMEMSYPVTPPSLLNGLNPGDKIGFSIDAGKSTIVAIKVIEAAQ